MGKLLITADIHGMYSKWNLVTNMLSTGDSLAVAGDLFDTRYGPSSNPDFKPELIREEFEALPNRTYYVYGNCDDSKFIKGFQTLLEFNFNGLSIIMNHGHRQLPDLTDYDIVIQGHSHVAKLDSIMGKVFLNPGSPTASRNGYPSIATLNEKTLEIINLKTGKTVFTLEL